MSIRKPSPRFPFAVRGKAPRSFARLAFSLLLGLSATAAWSQPAVVLPQASPAASVSQAIGYTRVTVEYHRPGVKGREIWGVLVPYGKVWRAGANDATVIEFSTDVSIQGHPLPKGRYGFFILPDKGEWTLIFSKTSKTWGAFTYDQKDDALRVKAAPGPSEFQERLAYGFDDLTDSSATLFLRWEKTRVAVPLTVEFRETAKANIKAGLPKAKPGEGEAYEWLNSARFYWTYGIDRKQAMEWVDKSIQIRPMFANLWAKAEWLAEEKKFAEAYRQADLAKAEAAKDPNPVPLRKLMAKSMETWPKAGK
ncbi:MAG: hypothetical protein JWP91_2828 [Fibrobacteres bacterium]|nr:hypothetical protein [Fibrobacterota bacterium]